jgi:eukaryotic-like serine/threonine-protein kinase
MSVSTYLKSAQFRKSTIRIVLIYIVVLASTWFGLMWYTDHGEYISVPDLHEMTLDEAIATLEERDLEYLVIDSLYDKKAKPGTVIEQSPAPESQVKEGRQVFLTVYRQTRPMERLGVKEGDFAAVAFIKLHNKGIEFDTLYEDNNVFVGSIIRLVYGGKRVGPESLVPRGERVQLVIGRAATSKIMVPDLHGKTCLEAESILDTLGLVCNCRFEGGGSVPTTQDSVTFRVCRQDPPFDPLSPGSFPGRIVDLWLYNEPCPRDSINP